MTEGDLVLIGCFLIVRFIFFGIYVFFYIKKINVIFKNGRKIN